MNNHISSQVIDIKKTTLIIHAISWWDRHNTVEWLNRFKYDQVKNIYSRNIVES